MKRGHALPLGGLLLLVAFAYSNALRGAFVFDDLAQIRDNPLVRSLASYLPGGAGAHGGRWLAYLTFALNHRVGGVDPAGYHAVNVAIHAACSALLYVLVQLTFRAPRLAASPLAAHRRAIGFTAAALFATHPLQTQAVTYVVQRLTSLATLFYLAAAVLYAAYRTGAGASPWRRRAAYALALLATLAAMKTKEIAFTLPLAIALWEATCFGVPRERRRLLALAPFLATLLVIPATLVLAHGSMTAALAQGTVASAAPPTSDPVAYLRTQVVVVLRYLALLAWPAAQNLDHDVAVETSWASPAVLGGLAVLGALAASGLAAWRWRREPAGRAVAFGIGWFFLGLAVESSVLPIGDLMNEHRVYLPSAGLFLAAAVGAAWVLARASPEAPGRATALAGCCLALLLAGLTLQRNAVWRDDLTLWSDAAAKSPAKARPRLNLGTALAEAGRLEDALPELREAARLDPRLPGARAQLGAALLATGRSAEGERELREALRLAPSDPEALFNLAVGLTRSGRRDEAKPLFARFLEVAPPAYAAARRFAAAHLAPPPGAAGSSSPR